MTEQEFLQRFDSGDKFNEKEMWSMMDYFREIEVIYGDCEEWTQNMTTIFLIGDRYFALEWERGLTKYQEDWVDKQPYEVTRKTRVVEETYWEPLNK